MRQRKNNKTAGFSLIEVVVGIALLGLVTVPVCASLVLSVRLNSHSQALMDARLQASGVVETLLVEGINVGAKDDDDELIWGDKQGGGEGQKAYWTRNIDGVTVTVTEVSDKPYYEVEVSSGVSVGETEETVELTTQVRKAGG